MLHDLSLLYWRQDSLEPALHHLQRSIAIKRVVDPAGLPNGLNGLGVLLTDIGRPDTAVSVLKECIALARSSGAVEDEPVYLVNLGLAFEKVGQPDSAEVYYARGLAAEHPAPNVQVRALLGMGDLRRAQGRHAQARTWLDSALAVARRVDMREDIKDAHHALAQLHRATGRYDLAFDHLEAYHRVRDTLMSADTERAMSELRMRYDTERRDRAYQELQAAQELTALRAERSRWLAIGIAVLALAAGVAGWALVQRNRQRARQREAELEQQALRLQMDPHFLFNALNTVPGLYATGDVAAANDHVGHLSQFLRLVLETSRRRTIPLEQEIDLVRHYLRISGNRHPGRLTWHVEVMPAVRPERIAIPPMLIQPLVENAIEHGLQGVSQGHVDVCVDRIDDRLHITVRDNGRGRAAAARRPQRRQGTSLGTQLVQQRIALFDRLIPPTEAVTVHDEHDAEGKPRGTTVHVRMRLQYLSEHAASGDRG